MHTQRNTFYFYKYSTALFYNAIKLLGKSFILLQLSFEVFWGEHRAVFSLGLIFPHYLGNVLLNIPLYAPWVIGFTTLAGGDTNAIQLFLISSNWPFGWFFLQPEPFLTCWRLYLLLPVDPWRSLSLQCSLPSNICIWELQSPWASLDFQLCLLNSGRGLGSTLGTAAWKVHPSRKLL